MNRIPSPIHLGVEHFPPRSGKDMLGTIVPTSFYNFTSVGLNSSVLLVSITSYAREREREERNLENEPHLSQPKRHESIVRRRVRQMRTWVPISRDTC